MTDSHLGLGQSGPRRFQAQIVLAGVLGAFFVSGLCGLIHEIVWTRLLRLVMGNTTFAITTVLCVFMAGLALGSYVGGRLIDRRNDVLRVFAILEAMIGLYCLLLPLLIGSTEPIYRLIYQNTHTSFYVFSLIRFFFCGLLCLSRSLARRRRKLAAVVVLGVTSVAIVAIPTWDVSRMSFGPFIEARRHSKDVLQSTTALKELVERSKILFHKEGLTTTITVKEFESGERALYVNGKPDASSTWDLHTQMLLAHVPLLLHPNPRSVLVIGLASGTTLGSAGLHSVETLDCVELAPEIIKATHFFDEYNHNILADPRVRILIADGRNHLALTDKQYDVIISEPSNPWIAGVADLFTLEVFQVCHERLNSRGVACIWLEGYHIDQDSFRSVVRTFGSVFEDVSVWHTQSADYLLIGS